MKEKTSTVDISQFEAKNCSIIKFTFKVWHEEKFNTDLYAQIRQQFLDAVEICQQSERDKTGFEPIAKAIGQPFRDIADKIADKEGIHGNLSINIEDDSILFESVLMSDEIHDKAAWEDLKMFFMQLIASFGANAAGQEWTKQLSPLFTNVITTGDGSGIHGSLDISFKAASL